MEEKKEIVFANGLNFNPPSQNAPEYIIGRLWFKVDDFKAFLDEHNTNNGGVNVDIKKSAKGNYYCALNTWKPTKPAGLEDAPQEEVDNSNVPF